MSSLLGLGGCATPPCAFYAAGANLDCATKFFHESAKSADSPETTPGRLSPPPSPAPAPLHGLRGARVSARLPRGYWRRSERATTRVLRNTPGRAVGRAGQCAGASGVMQYAASTIATRGRGGSGDPGVAAGRCRPPGAGCYRSLQVAIQAATRLVSNNPQQLPNTAFADCCGRFPLGGTMSESGV